MADSDEKRLYSVEMKLSFTMNDTVIARNEEEARKIALERAKVESVQVVLMDLDHVFVEEVE